MYIPFENLPLESKIWIYQSNRKFTDAEFEEINTATQAFINDWSAHGTSLEASYLLKYNRFIIFAVNPEIQAATGCSIDKSVQFIQDLEQKYQVDLLDKMNVTFKTKHLLNLRKWPRTKQLLARLLYLIIWLILSKNLTNHGKFPQKIAGTAVFFKAL